MELHLKRISTGEESTIGTLHELADPVEFQAFTLEDQPNEPKVPKETRIPAGRYQVKFREELSGLTKKYRGKYPWFTWHLWLQDVPDFEYVYIHVGNDDDHTDGCILVGDQAVSNVAEEGRILSSVLAYTRLYARVRDALESDEEVWITVEDYA